jgi:hypothetical protein
VHTQKNTVQDSIACQCFYTCQYCLLKEKVAGILYFVSLIAPLTDIYI